MAPAKAPDAGPEWPSQDRAWAVEKCVVGGTPSSRAEHRTGCPEPPGPEPPPHPSARLLLPVHRRGHRGGDCFHLTTATAPGGSQEHRPGCHGGNCQPRGQNLPPPLLRTQTLQQETEGQSQAHRGPHRTQKSRACLVTHPASHVHVHYTHHQHHPQAQKEAPQQLHPEAPFLGG